MFNFIRIFLVLIMISVGLTQLATARLSDPGDIDFFMEPSESDLESQVAGGIIRNLAQCEAYFGGPSRHCEAFLNASFRFRTVNDCIAQLGNDNPVCNAMENANFERDLSKEDIEHLVAGGYIRTLAQCEALFGGPSRHCEAFLENASLSNRTDPHSVIPVSNPQSTSETVTDI